MDTMISEIIEYCDEALSDAENLEYDLGIVDDYSQRNAMKIVKTLNLLREQLIVFKELDWKSIYREELQDEIWNNP